MTATGELRALVEHRDEGEAAEVLAYARRLLAEGQMPASLEGLPAMWRRDDERVPQDRPSSRYDGL